MKKYFPLISLLFFQFFAQGQSPEKIMKKLGDAPIFFIDSVQVDQSGLMAYEPTEIASVTVFKDKEALELMGEAGKDGVIYIETKDFARNRFWKYFSTKSAEYAKRVTTSQADSTIQYILNERILQKDFEGNLSSIDDSIFKKIEIIDKDELQKRYAISNRRFGVIIKSDKPDNLYKARKKF